GGFSARGFRAIDRDGAQRRPEPSSHRQALSRRLDRSAARKPRQQRRRLMSDANGANPEFSIDVQHVLRTFGQSVAVDNLTLQVARNTTFGFIGQNGAGKTTAIRMMVGLLAPTAGRIRIEG